MRWLPVILIIISSLPCHAQGKVNVQYTNRHFTTRDGLPKLETTAILQDRKGYLWVGTKGGLARYDGSVFKTYMAANGPMGGIGGLCELEDGRILVSGFKGMYFIDGDSVSALYADMRFSYYFCEALVVNNTAYLMLKTSNSSYNNCLACCYLVSFNPGTKAFDIIDTIRHNFTSFAFLDSTSFIINWNEPGSSYTSYKVFKPGSKPSKQYRAPVKLVTKTRNEKNESFTSGDERGTIYKVTASGDSALFRPIAKAAHSFSETSCYLHQLRDGSIYYCSSDDYLVRIQNNREEVIVPINIIHNVYEDREKNVWVTTEDGLYNFFNFSFRSYTFGLTPGKPDFISSIASTKDSTIWLGSYTTGLWRYDYKREGQKPEHADNVLTPVCYHPVIKNDTIFFPASGGFIYIVNGKVSYRDDSTYAHLYFYNDTATGQLLSGSSEIRYLDSGVMHTWIGSGQMGLDNLFVLSMSRDKFGRLWYCSSNAVGCINDDASIIKTSLKNIGTLFAVTMDGKKNLWFGGTGGIWFYNYHIARKINHPFLHSVGALYNYHNKYLLASTTKGLAVLDLSSFYSSGHCNIRTYAHLNGFTALDHSQNSIWENADGTVFINAPNTVLLFHPDSLYADQQKTSVYIEHIDASADNTHWRKYNSVDNYLFGKPFNNLRIRFKAVSFSHTNDIRYRYRLRNFSEWTLPSDGNEAVYTNLPPGTYTFEVAATNDNGGKWSTVASADITIHAAWYQTIAFKLLCLLLVAGMGGYGMQLRNRKRIAELQRGRERDKLKIIALKNKVPPHFKGNVDNNIIALIEDGNKGEAMRYYTLVSRLESKMRLSDEVSHTLGEELQFVKDYLALEKLRFKEKIVYHINVSPDVDTTMHVPGMIVHTLVENAIKHGLMDKQDSGVIEINADTSGDELVITVADNGIGREAAAKRSLHSTKMGLNILKEQISIYNRYNKTKMHFEVKDLFTDDGKPIGTVFFIFIPHSYNFLL